MIGRLILIGLAVGLVAGLAAGAFAFAVGGPSIDAAVAIEAESARSAGHEHRADQDRGAGEPLVSRGGQKAGTFLAAGIYGAAIGGLFALAFAFSRGRSGLQGDATLALFLGAALFAAVVAVPFLKYPANPPAVGDPETIHARTGYYFTMVAISLLALLAAWRAGRDLPRGGRAARIGAGAAVFAAAAGGGALLMPAVGPVDPSFPSALLWEFRMVSVGTQAVLWGSLVAIFALVVRRSSQGVRRASPAMPETTGERGLA